jgi:hypothetical protein
VAALEQNVFRLDVAVNHAEAVGIAEGVRDFAGDRDGIGNRELPFALESRPQRLAGDERHHVVQQPARIAAVEQRQDVRMLEARRRSDLTQKAVGTEDRAELGVQHLDGDVPIVPGVVREVDRGHTPGTELALDDVSRANVLGQP